MSNITLENWESGHGECARRGRGPKPVARGQLLKLTAWLDGELCWHEGALGWKTRGQIVVADAAHIERAGRALDKLEARGVPIGERRERWRLARQLGAVRATDFDKLCAVSRRRNPAALARLARLLVLESREVELPQSPAHALLRAWPHSRTALESIIENEDGPRSARDLAAFVVGAAKPCSIADLPKSARPIAALGARFEAELAAFEWPQSLLKMAREDEKLAHRIVALTRSQAPFAPNASELQRLARAHGLTAAWQIATQLCSLGDDWPELSAISALFSTPADEKLMRETALLWRRARREWNCEMQRILARLALEAPAAIEPFTQLASELRGMATQVVERSSRNRKKRRFLALGSVETAAFLARVMAQMPALLAHLSHQALQTPDAANCFYLWREVALKGLAQTPNAQWHRQGIGHSSQIWTSGYRDFLKQEVNALSRLTRLAGADFARLGWEEGRHREWAVNTRLYRSARPPADGVIASWVQLMRELPQSNVTLRAWNRLHRRIGPGARAVMAELVAATREVAPDAVSDGPEARVHIVEGLLWTPPLASQARASWRHLPAMIRASAPDLSQCGDSTERAADTVAELAKYCHLLNVEPALRAPLARIFAHVYRAHVKAKDWDGQADLACEIALRLCHASSPDEALLADFEYVLRHAFEAIYADRDSEKEIEPALSLVPNRPHLARALRYGLEVAPARTLRAMEHLGALKRTHQLESLRVLENSAATLDSSWDGITRDAPAIADAARELAHWQILAGEENAPPSGALKIGQWPHKWAREIEALQLKVADNPKLAPRLENLRARLADEPKWRAQQADELGQLLENATKRAALAALERVIEDAFRARLRALCGELPAHFAFDDDWFNALLLGSDVEYNRKWARALLRHEVAGQSDWREQLPGNAQFLAELSARGADANFYLSEFGRARGDLWLWLETKPLGILQMGNRFNTCLSRGGCNAFAGVANAIELNKRVVYARDQSGHIVARQLWAVSEDCKLIGFHIYSTFSDEERKGLEAHFAAHAREFARSCGLELADAGAVTKLVAPNWYDDGARAWGSDGESRATEARLRV